MNAFALHLPEGRGLSRWALAGVTILIAHAAIVAAVVLWYARSPVEPNILPAIAVTLARWRIDTTAASGCRIASRLR